MLKKLKLIFIGCLSINFICTAQTMPLDKTKNINQNSVNTVLLGDNSQNQIDSSLVTNKEDNKPLILSLENAIKIALSENTSVKVASMEITRNKYAKRGAYSALFPQVNGTGSFQRTIKKQVMYMDFDFGKFSSLMGGGASSSTGEKPGNINIEDIKKDHPEYTGGHPSWIPKTTDGNADASKKQADGFEVGRWNTFNAGIAASMPLINAQLWQSLKISGVNVDIAVEKARESKIEMVTQVKQAYYSVLLAKEAFNVYKEVYNNALASYNQTEMRYNAQKASELDLLRAKSTLAGAIPNVYNAENSLMLSLWQLKAVVGLDLDKNIDVSGSLQDNAAQMFKDIHQNDNFTIDKNTSLKQLTLQAEQLAIKSKMEKLAYLPTINATFSYSVNAMDNGFNFSEYRWTPHAFIGLSLNIPIFSGGKRYYDIKQTHLQRQEIEYQKIDIERKLKIAVRQALNTMESNMNTYNASLDAVSLAQKAYDIASESYKLGKSTITELNASQLQLTQAKLATTQSIYNFLVAKSNLEKTLGFDNEIQ